MGIGFVGYFLGWLMGLGDLIWVGSALLMAIPLVLRRRSVVVPRGFGLWLAFIGFVIASGLAIDTPLRAVGFGYRFLLYLAATVAFVYVYNARHLLTDARLIALGLALWLQTVLGGWLGVIWPSATYRSPLALVLPSQVLQNELVAQMSTRSLAQVTTFWNGVMLARPSAPFLYTNTWGNVYSVLLPIVAVALFSKRLKPSLLGLALLASLVPAAYTQNRGMLIGIAVSLLYAAWRLEGRQALVARLALVVMAGFGAVFAPALATRLTLSSTTEDRASLYLTTFEQVLASPILGYGAPRPASDGLPSLGTQGQLWMVLFSHGFVALALFIAFFVKVILDNFDRRDPFGVALVAIVATSLVESLFYGQVGTGLIIAMVAAAAVSRGQSVEGQVTDEARSLARVD